MGIDLIRLVPISLMGKEPPPLNPSSRWGLLAVSVAQGEIGNGEVGGNNKGPHVVKYRRGIDDGGAWCADFISWSFLQVADKMKEPVPFQVSRSAKTLYRRVLAAGYKVNIPVKGDVVCWTRGAADAATGHIGIVVRVEEDLSTFHTLEGNRGGFPSTVREFAHVIDEGGLIGFARPPL